MSGASVGYRRAAAIASRKIHVRIKRVRLNLEHGVDIFPLVITNSTGEWHHTCTSESHLKSVIEGLRIGVEMLGGSLDISEVPSEHNFEMVDPEHDHA